MISTTTDKTGVEIVAPQTHPAHDATHFRAIIQANKNMKDAQQALAQAVREARAAGNSWTVIGAALDISKQAVQQRFS